MAWNQVQCRQYAKDLLAVEFERGRVLKYLTGQMRAALVEARVLSIVRGQEAEYVSVRAIDDLLVGVREEIKKQAKHPEFFE